MFIAFLLAAAPATNVCTKLKGEFIQNERQMALQHYVDQGFVDVFERMGNKAEADKTRASIDSNDERHKLDGDRITTLILANKCSPPDHITSWKTYWSEIEQEAERLRQKAE